MIKKYPCSCNFVSPCAEVRSPLSVCYLNFILKPLMVLFLEEAFVFTRGKCMNLVTDFSV